MLELVKITKCFGGVDALREVDFKVELRGGVIGIIGPNGAGKTTLFNVVSGTIKPTSGKVFFRGEDITGKKPHFIAEKGLVRTFQATTVFANLSVLANILVAGHITAKISTAGGGIRLPMMGTMKSEERDRAINILKLANLENLKDELAKNLPHGYKRALGVAIALAAEPKLVCLDEPVTGMNAVEIDLMLDFIGKIRQRGIAVLLVEHHMRAVMSICNRITVLNFGRKIAEGTPEEIQNNEKVIEAYLGRE